MTNNNIYTIYNKYKVQILIIALIIPIILITIGCIFFTDLFWDKFIWKYYWGPIEADATDKPVDGIKAGYNVVSTITYALVLTLFLFGIYKILVKLKVNVELHFLVAVSPFIVMGAVNRVLEDSHLFKKPIVYLFISPIIYFIIAGITIACLYLGVYTENIYKKKGFKHVLIILSIIVLILDLAYIFVYLVLNDYFTHLIHPFWMILLTNLTIIIRLFIYFKIKNELDSNAVLFSSGFIILSVGMYFIGEWLLFDEWGDAGNGKNLIVIPVIILLAIIATVIMFIFSKKVSVKYPTFGIYTVGMNIALIYSHFLDASATFIGIDYYGYHEKHVLPNYLIEIFDTAVIMFILKAIVIGLVIYLIDIAYKKELENKQILVGLVKLFVFILGFAPGSRDMIRLAMGV